MVIKRPLAIWFAFMVVIVVCSGVGDSMAFADDDLITIHIDNGTITWDRDETLETDPFGGIKGEDELFQIYDTLINQNNRLLVGAATQLLTKYLSQTTETNDMPLVLAATPDGYEAVTQAQIMGADEYEILEEFAESGIQYYFFRIIVLGDCIEFRNRCIIKRGDGENDYLYLADFVICFSYDDRLSDEEKTYMRYHSYECPYGYLYSWIENCY